MSNTDLSEWGIDPDEGDERPPENPCEKCGEGLVLVEEPKSGYVGTICPNRNCERDL